MSEIRSQIDGEFNGTDDEVVYKLMNGQVWQQIGYRYRYHYLYMPAVQIVREPSGYVMHVSGFPEPIPVRQIS